VVDWCGLIVVHLNAQVNGEFVHFDIQTGERLKEERKRLKLSQQAIADAVGVRREMWAKYEAGSEPGAGVLARACDIGIDVLYTLTGRRSVTYQTHSQGATVTPIGAMESGFLTRDQVLGIVLDAMYAAGKTLPARTVFALTETAMTLQREGIPVNKSAVLAQLKVVK